MTEIDRKSRKTIGLRDRTIRRQLSESVSEQALNLTPCGGYHHLTHHQTAAAVSSLSRSGRWSVRVLAETQLHSNLVDPRLPINPLHLYPDQRSHARPPLSLIPLVSLSPSRLPSAPLCTICRSPPAEPLTLSLSPSSFSASTVSNTTTTTTTTVLRRITFVHYDALNEQTPQRHCDCRCCAAHSLTTLSCSRTATLF